MNKQEKEQIVSDLAEKFRNYKFVYITDTASLTAAVDNNLRRSLHKHGIRMQVAKNTLIRKAMELSGNNYGELPSVLKGTSSLLFSDDAKLPAVAIKEFRKTSDKPLLKGAYIDSDVFLGDNQIDVLTKLKSRNELIGEVIGLLQSPAQNVVSALQSGGNILAGLVKTLEERPQA
ncbi:MAG TPA: 50S ribosomal protein L10 [Bacteroidia bacterium]|nr:50S ribosomal protein L10 [Bacteroidia bacterium]